MGIRIITDTSSDISPVEAKKLGISLIPIKVIFDDIVYREGIDITIDGFYEKLVQADKLPTTSQPAPDDFLTHFNEAKEARESVVVLLISGKLSGTLQSAMIAKEMSDYEDIHIIDTNTSIMSLRFLTEEAVKLRAQGKGVAEIVATIMELKERIVLLAMVDTLEFLQKGGRLSKSSAFLGTLLKFKPVIALRDGTLGVVAKERGTNKGITRIIELIPEFGEIDRQYPVYLGYTAENSICSQLKLKLRKAFDLPDLNMYPVGCAVGTHVGPGACIVTYVKK